VRGVKITGNLLFLLLLLFK